MRSQERLFQTAGVQVAQIVSHVESVFEEQLGGLTTLLPRLLGLRHRFLALPLALPPLLGRSLVLVEVQKRGSLPPFAFEL